MSGRAWLSPAGAAARSDERDIRPLFTDMDVAHLKDQGVALDDSDFVCGHAQNILDRSAPGPGSGEPSWRRKGPALSGLDQRLMPALAV